MSGKCDKEILDKMVEDFKDETGKIVEKAIKKMVDISLDQASVPPNNRLVEKKDVKT